MADLLPPMDHGSRRDRLRARLAELQAGALLVTASANVRWLTGFDGSNGQVVVRADGTDLLLTDARYEGRAPRDELEVVLTRTVLDTVLDRTEGRLCFEGDHLTHRRGTELQGKAGERRRETVSCHGLVEGLRTGKDDAEVARLQRACEITGEAFTQVVEGLRPGVTEHDLAVRIERRMIDLGAEAVAFDSIVASGPNGAVPHHAPSGRRIEDGDLVTLDIGARVDGYHADMTRTVAFGQPSHRMREVYELVRRAQAAGVEAVVAGATCGDVDAAARTVIDEAGHGEHFVHGIGHGVGLDIHEAPIVTAEPTATLAPSTVLTVEPGVYLPGTGGVRIEDTVLVTADGPALSLTTPPRELLILPA